MSVSRDKEEASGSSSTQNISTVLYIGILFKISLFLSSTVKKKKSLKITDLNCASN